MTAPFSFAAFQAQQAQNPPVGPRRSPLSFASFQAQQEEEEERIRAERGARDGVLPAVVTTAQAPKPFERALARGVMASGTTDPAFGRESDLTPLARQQFQRAAAPRIGHKIPDDRHFPGVQLWQGIQRKLQKNIDLVVLDQIRPARPQG